MPLEALLVVLAIAVSIKLLGPGQRHGPWLLSALLLGGSAAALAVTQARDPQPPAPVRLGREGFATSGACRSCHPAEYASWHASYHRRMTQLPSLDAVAAPRLREGGRLHIDSLGRRVELFGRGGQLRALLPDPGITSAAPRDGYEAAFRAAPEREVAIELLTGSHHQQAFWVKGARAGELRALPAVYLIDAERLIPRRDAFLTPPDAPEHAVRWNSNCVQCHAVAGAPEHDLERDVFTTSVAELGVACEACHGEGEAHARSMQNPLERYRAHDTQATPPGIVNPRGLDAKRGSQVCGRCHSYFFPKQESEWWQHGFARSYAPGDDLALSQLLLSPARLREPGAPAIQESADSLFYADGTIRVAGREYNGLSLSPCFERGHGERQLGCTSCHSLHQSEPNDQLGHGMEGNRACRQCHEREGRELTAHTHHAAGSSGSLCYNCHMPQTTYALLGAIRSHRIDSPTFDARTRDRPNACSLCHLERSEAWAAERAASWYGRKPTLELDRAPGLGDATTPAGAVFALAGDAAVRAITAAALGRPQSDATAPALRQQLLKELAADDYAAVRFIAERSRRQVDAHGQALGAARGPAPTAGALPSATLERLRALRDNRPVTIAE